MATNLQFLLGRSDAPQVEKTVVLTNRNNADGCILARLMMWAVRHSAR